MTTMTTADLGREHVGQLVELAESEAIGPEGPSMLLLDVYGRGEVDGTDVVALRVHDRYPGFGGEKLLVPPGWLVRLHPSDCEADR